MAEDIRQKIFHKSRELWRQKKRESKKQVGKYFQIFKYFFYIFKGNVPTKKERESKKQVGHFFQIFVIFSRETWRQKQRERKKQVGKYF